MTNSNKESLHHPEQGLRHGHTRLPKPCTIRVEIGEVTVSISDYPGTEKDMRETIDVIMSLDPTALELFDRVGQYMKSKSQEVTVSIGLKE